MMRDLSWTARDLEKLSGSRHMGTDGKVDSVQSLAWRKGEVDATKSGSRVKTETFIFIPTQRTKKLLTFVSADDKNASYNGPFNSDDDIFEGEEPSGGVEPDLDSVHG